MILFDLFRYEPTKNLPLDSALSIKLRGPVEPLEVERVFNQLFNAYVNDGGQAYSKGKLKAHKEAVTCWAMLCAAEQRPLPVFVAASLRMLAGLDPFGIDDSSKPERKHIREIRKLLKLELTAYYEGRRLSDRDAERLIRVDKKSIASWRKASWYKASFVALARHVENASVPTTTKHRLPTNANWGEEARLIEGIPATAPTVARKTKRKRSRN